MLKKEIGCRASNSCSLSGASTSLDQETCGTKSLSHRSQLLPEAQIHSAFHFKVGKMSAEFDAC